MSRVARYVFGVLNALLTFMDSTRWDWAVLFLIVLAVLQPILF